jgi:hypothetical protein
MRWQQLTAGANARAGEPTGCVNDPERIWQPTYLSANFSATALAGRASLDYVHDGYASTRWQRLPKFQDSKTSSKA